jgi:hypothetical protein
MVQKSFLFAQKANAGVAKWQTRRIQNPVGVKTCVGSSPTSGSSESPVFTGLSAFLPPDVTRQIAFPQVCRLMFRSVSHLMRPIPVVDLGLCTQQCQLPQEIQPPHRVCREMQKTHGQSMAALDPWAPPNSGQHSSAPANWYSCAMRPRPLLFQKSAMLKLRQPEIRALIAQDYPVAHPKAFFVRVFPVLPVDARVILKYDCGSADARASNGRDSI